MARRESFVYDQLAEENRQRVQQERADGAGAAAREPMMAKAALPSFDLEGLTLSDWLRFRKRFSAFYAVTMRVDVGLRGWPWEYDPFDHDGESPLTQEQSLWLTMSLRASCGIAEHLMSVDNLEQDGLKALFSLVQHFEQNSFADVMHLMRAAKSKVARAQNLQEWQAQHDLLLKLYFDSGHATWASAQLLSMIMDSAPMELPTVSAVVTVAMNECGPNGPEPIGVLRQIDDQLKALVTQGTFPSSGRAARNSGHVLAVSKDLGGHRGTARGGGRPDRLCFRCGSTQHLVPGCTAADGAVPSDWQERVPEHLQHRIQIWNQKRISSLNYPMSVQLLAPRTLLRMSGATDSAMTALSASEDGASERKVLLDSACTGVLTPRLADLRNARRVSASSAVSLRTADGNELRPTHVGTFVIEVITSQGACAELRIPGAHYHPALPFVLVGLHALEEAGGRLHSSSAAAARVGPDKRLDAQGPGRLRLRLPGGRATVELYRSGGLLLLPERPSAHRLDAHAVAVAAARPGPSSVAESSIGRDGNGAGPDAEQARTPVQTTVAETMSEAVVAATTVANTAAAARGPAPGGAAGSRLVPVSPSAAPPSAAPGAAGADVAAGGAGTAPATGATGAAASGPLRAHRVHEAHGRPAGQPRGGLRASELHLTLGHLGGDRLRDAIAGIDNISLSGPARLSLACPTCRLVKATRAPVRRGRPPARSSGPRRRFFWDLFGRKRTSASGMQYAALFIDAWTKFCWIYFLRTREAADLVDAAERWWADMNAGGACDPGAVLEGDSELFCNALKDFAANKGLVLRRVPPHEHESSLAERYIRTITETAECIFHGSRLPFTFWPYFFQHATRALNAVRGRNRDQSPHELALGAPDDFSAVFPVGSLAYVLDSFAEAPRQKGRAVSRAKIGIYLGADPTNRTIGLLFLLDTRSVVRRRSFTCDSSVFPSPTDNAERLLRALRDRFAGLPVRHPALAAPLPGGELPVVEGLTPEGPGAVSATTPSLGQAQRATRRRVRFDVGDDEDDAHAAAGSAVEEGQDEEDVGGAVHAWGDEPGSHDEDDDVTGTSNAWGDEPGSHTTAAGAGDTDAHRDEKGSRASSDHDDRTMWQDGEIDSDDAQGDDTFVAAVRRPGGRTESFTYGRGHGPAFGDGPAPVVASRLRSGRDPKAEARRHALVAAVSGASSRVLDSHDSSKLSEAYNDMADELVPGGTQTVPDDSERKVYDPEPASRPCREPLSMWKMHLLSPREQALWRRAERAEWLGLSIDNGCFGDAIPIAEARRQGTVVPGFFIHKVKADNRLKARFVASGNKASDYERGRFPSPAICMDLLLLAMVVGLTRGHTMFVADVPQAYIRSSLDKPHFLYPVPRVAGARPGTALPIKKALYGLTSAGYLWAQKLFAALTEIGWEQSRVHPCLWSKRGPKTTWTLCAFVDDLCMWLPDEESDAAFAALAAHDVPVNVTKGSGHLLGMEFQHHKGDDARVELRVAGHIDSLAATVDLSGVRRQRTPGSEREVLEFPDTGDSHPEFAAIVGSLMWITSLRSDARNATRRVSRHAARNGPAHMDALLKIVAYLVSTRDRPLILRPIQGDSSSALSAFSDATWADDASTRKSVIGHVFRMGSSTFAAASRTMSTMAWSSMESETAAAAAAARDLVFYRDALADIDMPQSAPSTLYVDNEAARLYLGRWMSTARSKHLDVKHAAVRELVREGAVAFERVPTTRQLADVMTKNTGPNIHAKLCKAIMDGMPLDDEELEGQ